MIEISDVGKIKAEVEIVYKPDGIEKAKEDLKSLAEAAGGIGEGTSQASDSLGGLEEQAGKTAESVQGLVESAKPLSEGFAAGEKAASELTDAFVEQSDALDEVKASHEAAQEAISATNQAMGEGGSSATEFSRNVEAINKSFDASAAGLSDFYENMSVMQDALVNPEPFNMIQQHLSETGQSWSDFVSSVGPENETMLRSMADNAGFLQQYSQAIGEEFLPGNAVDRAQAYTDQFLAMSDATRGATGAVDEFTKAVDPLINASGGVGASMYGPAPYSLIDMINKNGGIGSEMYGPLLPPEEPRAIGIAGGIGDITEGVGGFFGGILETMNQIAMPLMAVQMIGMAVQQVGQSIYDSAAIAEGSGAHGFGTFTGSVDALAQSSAKAGQVFSESFGQQVVPLLQAMSDTTQGSGGIAGFLGQWTGGIVDFAAGVGAMGLGGIVDALTLPMQLLSGSPSLGSGPIQFGMEALGLSPANGVTPKTPAQVWLDQNMPNVQNYVDQQTAQGQFNYAATLNEANDPAFLATQNQNAAAARYLQYREGQFDSAHPISFSQMAYDATKQWFESGGTIGGADYSDIVRGEITRATGGSYGGGVDPAAIWAQQLLHPGISYDQAAGMGYDFSTGCFPAGTRVLMADGGERDIDMLQPGEQVLAHDGERQIPTVVRARIVPPPKPVYELIFDDGHTLTLTDSHPIATTGGWKALSVAAAKRDNPDLEVSTLHIGDLVYTSDETTCTLLSIEKRDIVQIYNIEVGEPHTFYAAGILVHNKVQSSFADNNGEINKTIPVSVNWNISGELEKTWQSVSNWSLSGELQKVWQTVSSWNLSGELQKVWQTVSSWNLSGELEKVWQSMSSWNLSGELEKMWNAMSSWSITGDLEKLWNASSTWDISGELTHTFEGAADWVGKGLDHLFTGEADWQGKDLVHEFIAQATWSATGLNPTFNVAPLFTGIPGFAGGVENFGGGYAFVGEGGNTEVIAHNGQYSLVDSPALVNLPPGSSVYPMQDLGNFAFSNPMSATGGASAMSQGISLGGGGGGSAPQSVNVVVQLDSQSIVSAIGMPLASNIRIAGGLRSY